MKLAPSRVNNCHPSADMILLEARIRGQVSGFHTTSQRTENNRPGQVDYLYLVAAVMCVCLRSSGAERWVVNTSVFKPALLPWCTGRTRRRRRRINPVVYDFAGRAVEALGCSSKSLLSENPMYRPGCCYRLVSLLTANLVRFLLTWAKKFFFFFGHFWIRTLAVFLTCGAN